MAALGSAVLYVRRNGVFYPCPILRRVDGVFVEVSLKAAETATPARPEAGVEVFYSPFQSAVLPSYWAIIVRPNGTIESQVHFQGELVATCGAWDSSVSVGDNTFIRKSFHYFRETSGVYTFYFGVLLNGEMQLGRLFDEESGDFLFDEQTGASITIF